MFHYFIITMPLAFKTNWNIPTKLIADEQRGSSYRFLKNSGFQSQKKLELKSKPEFCFYGFIQDIHFRRLGTQEDKHYRTRILAIIVLCWKNRHLVTWKPPHSKPNHQISKSIFLNGLIVLQKFKGSILKINSPLSP